MWRWINEDGDGFQRRGVCSCARGRGLDNFKKMAVCCAEVLFFFFAVEVEDVKA